MAPEQARGEAVDARADIYALGVTLAELATGVLPTLASATWADADGAPTGEAPAVPGWLSEVVARCIAPDPGDRFPSMAALAAALRGCAVEGRGLAELVAQPSEAPAERRTNIEPEGDVFVGRVAELTALRPGLIAITGPAGIGKTRLARRWARAAYEATGIEAWCCDLSQVSDRDGLLHAVAASLDLPLRGGDPDGMIAQIGHALAGRAAILVLDTFDALGAEAETILRWHRAAPGATILVTSRNVTDVTCTQCLVLDVLPAEEARALVVARALERGVALDEASAIALARRLDGVPLALELAAGRLGVVSGPELLAGMSLATLRSARGDVPDRQRTLERAIAWSIDLLGPAEREALARLSVFVEGATLESAEAVGVGAALEGLVARSLARLMPETRRYTMLTAVREVAAGLLSATQRADAERAHLAWFSALGTDAALAALDMHGGTALRRVLLAEAGNLVAASQRAIAHGEPDAAARCASAAAIAFAARGPAATGVAVCRAALAAGPSPPRACDLYRRLTELLMVAGNAHEVAEAADRGLALAASAGLPAPALRTTRGMAALRLATPAEADAFLLAALAEAQALGDRAAEAATANNVGLSHLDVGRLEEASACLLRAGQLAADVGHRRIQAVALGNLGIIHARRGNGEAARRAYGESAAILRELGDRSTEAVMVANLGILLDLLEDYPAAEALLDEALEIQRAIGYRREEGRVLGNRAALRMHAGKLEAAREDYRAALAIHAEVGNRRSERVDLVNLAELHHLTGARAEASACLRAALANAEEAGDALVGGVCRLGLAAHARLDGDLPGAEALIDAAERGMGANASPRERAQVATARGQLAIARGDRPTALAMLAIARTDGLGVDRHEIEALAQALGEDGGSGNTPDP
jgi:predicted ATPase/Flp pilus assembly protein TadD